MSTLPAIELLTTDNATAYYTTRGTCIPLQPYSGFNLCHYTGDSPAHITECRNLLSRHFNMPSEHIIIPRQTHSTDVAAITSIPADPSDLEGIDALVTNLHNIIIGVNTADCVPVVLMDSTTGIYGIAHAGWRGAVNGIVEATIRAMTVLGSQPSDIIAAMGPSICRNCFEVGKDVARFFDNDCVSETAGEKPHVSLQKHIYKILTDNGLNHDNIKPFNDSLCTRCHPDKYWSARKLGINSGRIYTFIVIK